MRAQIARLEAAIETIESVRGLVQPGAALPSRNGGDASFSHDAFFGMKAADAARLYLSKVKKTTSPKVIAEALIEGGWKTSSQNPAENMRTILNRNATFVVINGEFGLAEWYPGRKTAGRRRGTNVTSISEESSSSESASEDEDNSSSSEEESS
jgi:hypothetical protein